MTNLIPFNSWPVPSAIDGTGQLPPRSIEEMLNAWMDAKKNASGSAKTKTAYFYTMTWFRETLLSTGIDLDGPPRLIAEIAQVWARQPHPEASIQKPVTATTINQRLSIISSWYNYVLKMYRDETGITENPIGRIERPKVQANGETRAIEREEVKEILGNIDTSTIQGQQAYAIISIAVNIGRRVTEITNMQLQHLTIHGEKVTILFPRTKRAKVMKDDLPPLTAKMLLSYLHSWYGDDLSRVSGESPVWITLDRNQYHGKAMSVRTMQRICERVCGTHFHVLRATFAVTMEKAGARVSEIQRRLGHSSLSTTGIYLSAIRSAENPYGTKMEELYGMKE